MEECETATCSRPAEVEKVRTSVFSMTGTASESARTIKICIPCAEQEERMSLLSRPERGSTV